MRTKQEILSELKEGLAAGIITNSDIVQITAHYPQADTSAPKLIHKSDKTSAIDIMFYIAGIVLFSTIMSIIIQSWEDSSARIIHIMLSTGIGLFMWFTAYYLIKNSAHTDIRVGLTNALLLTGSFLSFVGGFIITNETVGGHFDFNLIIVAITLGLLGALHIGFDALIKHKFILLMGVLLSVTSFTTLILGMLESTTTSMDIRVLILLVSAALLAYSTRVISKIRPERSSIRTSFDGFAAFFALTSMYVASYGDYDILWLCALIGAILGIFYLSIILQNKHLLGSGAFFMVLTIITISFKYFSGYGITFSLIVATIGLLGSAATASIINNKYFKKSTI